MTMTFERHPQADELVEAVRVYANRGWSPAQIIKSLLETYGEDLPADAQVRRCRSCGCTDAQACPGGCWWVEPDLCSQCSAGQPGDFFRPIIAAHAEEIRRALLDLKRRNGWSELGLS